MRLRQRLSFRAKVFAGLLAVGVAPMLAMGWLSYRTSQAALLETLGTLQGQYADELARFAHRLVVDAADNVRLAGNSIPFQSLSPEQRRDVLKLPYPQFPIVNRLALFDTRGERMGAPILRHTTSDGTAGLEREIIGDADFELFSKQVPPLDLVRRDGVAFGPPYRSADNRSPRVAIGVRLDSGMLLGAEVSLQELEQRLWQFSGQDRVAAAVDGRGQPFAYGRSSLSLSPEETALAADTWGQSAALVRTVRRHDGQPWLAAGAPVSRLGWTILYAERSTVASRAAQKVRQNTLFWASMALVLTVFVSALLARSLSRPIGALATTVEAISNGEYERRVALAGNDELGDLAAGLNRMADEIQRRDEEIRHWNEELQQRVEERTTALKAAQEQVVRSQKLTALGSLGAGVAHELNNPMTGILGLLSLLKSDIEQDSPLQETVDMVLEQAQRVTDVVRDFKRFADNESQQGGAIVSPIKVTKLALFEHSPQLRSQGIRVRLRYGLRLPGVQADEYHLQHALGHLICNAADAMPDGGRLCLDIASIGGDAVRVSIRDSGPGIPPDQRDRIFDPFFTTKTSQTKAGLGLSVAHSLIHAQHGQITVDNDNGRGTTFHVVLPAAAQAAHLS